MEYSEKIENPAEFGRPGDGAESRRKRAESAAEGSVPLLPIYLREMGATPLLDREGEVALARQLEEARIAIAKLLLKLPASCQNDVLQGDLSGPKSGQRWPLRELESACARLSEIERRAASTAVKSIARDVRDHRRRLDHARDALILANLRLVTHIVKKYSNHGIAFLDLIQEGNIGLMKAVEKFEWERGHKFSTYAYWWIKQAITRAIADKALMIRIPVHVTEKLKRMRRAARALEEELGRKPTPQEIARKARLSMAQIDELLDIVQDPQPLEGSGASEDDNGVLPFVADENAPCPLERALQLELKEKVHAALRVLDRREEEVIRLRFGIGRPETHTLEEIGKVLKLSRERVRQIEKTALGKIQSARESKELIRDASA